ncbi:hypothetical protein RIR_jg17559.t1 [Rhizophagus irregularis DAOM 181602=DAOM 197198]|nr:hypothetical protein RIR_jg17559.t1 [Rhizophagus irregularis DAOM 181602=DAOM 197198]
MDEEERIIIYCILLYKRKDNNDEKLLSHSIEVLIDVLRNFYSLVKDTYKALTAELLRNGLMVYKLLKQRSVLIVLSPCHKISNNISI